MSPLKFALTGLTLLSAATCFSQVTVYVGDSQVMFTDSKPIIYKGRVMVPLRSVFEKLGATVEWDPMHAVVHVTRDTQRASLWIGDQTAEVNGERRTMDVEARNSNGRVLVPLRFISESIGAGVNWDPATREVHIIAPKQSLDPAS